MKYFVFNDPINDENAQKFLNLIHENEGLIHIGFSSVGGDKGLADFIINALNENKERVTLSAIAGVYSSGFRIFAKFEGKKSMAFGCRGMYHYSGQEIRVMSNGKCSYTEHEASLRTMKNFDQKEDEAFAQQFMTASEFKKMKRGEDVFFDYGRMKEMFPTVELL